MMRAGRPADFAVQPITTTGDSVLCGHEFLVRLTTRGGFITPDVVFEAATKYGILQDVDRYLFTAALELLDEPAHGAGYINLFPTTLLDDGIAVHIKDAVDAGMRVVIELSEQAHLDDWGVVFERVKSLQAAGVEFALDDFGAGTSNMVALMSLGFDHVKFDKRLIHAGRTDLRARDMIARTVAMCHDAGSRVIAEGVEDDRDRGMAFDLGFDAMQGYGIARPMRVEEAEDMGYNRIKGIISNLCRR